MVYADLIVPFARELRKEIREECQVRHVRMAGESLQIAAEFLGAKVWLTAGAGAEPVYRVDRGGVSASGETLGVAISRWEVASGLTFSTKCGACDVSAGAWSNGGPVICPCCGSAPWKPSAAVVAPVTGRYDDIEDDDHSWQSIR